MAKKTVEGPSNAAEIARLMQSGAPSVVVAPKQRKQLGGPQFDRGQKVAQESVQIEPGNETKESGRATKLHGKSASAAMDQIPADPDAARAILKMLGYEPARRIPVKDAEAGLSKEQMAELRAAHKFLGQTYKGDYTEKLASQLEYLKDSGYELARISDKNGPMGIASGWHLGKTGFQIDYLSLMEFPRDGSRDVAAGLAIMRLMASRHHAQALWVEVDPEMRAHYEKAGFQSIASPGGPEKLEMMVFAFPGTDVARRLEENPASLWKDHVDAWYDANWAHLPREQRSEGEKARAEIKAAADRGDMIWIQTLP